MSPDRIAKCPRCSSDRVKRSRHRNFVESFLKTVNIRPYRCIHCGWRGFRYSKESVRKARAKYGLLQIVLILLVIALTVVAVLYYISREEPREPLSHQNGVRSCILAFCGDIAPKTVPSEPTLSEIACRPPRETLHCRTRPDKEA